MIYYNRLQNIDLSGNQSAFLWGPRKTGKSTLLRQKFPSALVYDFLKSDAFLKYSKEPYRFREELMSGPKKGILIVDEIQKIPAILDEIHYLIESSDYQFILCGSSARKLKRSDVNLLGGRAWKFHLFPLVRPELTDFDLLKVFSNGLIPSHYKSSNPKRFLKSYVEDYLTHEIQAEGLVRNLPYFMRFMESLRFCHGELINYSNIARDCYIDSKTVKEYFQILEDTLVGYHLYPYTKKGKRATLHATPKFYLFDVGIANYIKHVSISDLKGTEAGKSLEHFIFLELQAHRHYIEKEYDIKYWRTTTGHEVDFVCNDGQIAIEVKISSNLKPDDLKGIRIFQEEHKPQRSIIVCMENEQRLIQTKHGEIEVMPFKIFLDHLWGHKII